MMKKMRERYQAAKEVVGDDVLGMVAGVCDEIEDGLSKQILFVTDKESAVADLFVCRFLGSGIPSFVFMTDVDVRDDNGRVTKEMGVMVKPRDPDSEVRVVAGMFDDVKLAKKIAEKSNDTGVPLDDWEVVNSLNVGGGQIWVVGGGN